MKSLLFAVGIVVAVVPCITAMAQPSNEESKAVNIPLDEIWGYNMPGTYDVRKMDDQRAAKQVEAIRRALSTTPPQGKEAKAGFAVVGNGLDALGEANAVLVDGKKRSPTLPADSEISVVFFSYQFGPYVHLHKVARRGNVVEIRYRFVPHKTEEVTEHFALIPMGKLAPGKVQVEIIQSPMEQQFVIAGWKDIAPDLARRVVCKSFSFSVVKRERD